ncbi:hypothetical protein QUF31_21575 [Dickeya chrysanthemi]|uniref:Ppx/GppA phosphatase family protein n=1 Tax=Dickeya chrysanthemi TaxID=556 RepID=UPI0025A20A11|nr:hypothetical protein [Dickeya chrysanthemi]WJM87694.1 hypothetical protein QUF31_21575 [Dickeya chrysanthemi]
MYRLYRTVERRPDHAGQRNGQSGGFLLHRLRLPAGIVARIDGDRIARHLNIPRRNHIGARQGHILPGPQTHRPAGARGFQTLERESLQAGCIASTRRFFPGGKLSKKKWKDALTEIGAEFQQFANQYKALGWHEAIGSSGTHKAIGEICAAMKLTKGAIRAWATYLARIMKIARCLRISRHCRRRGC